MKEAFGSAAWPQYCFAFHMQNLFSAMLSSSWHCYSFHSQRTDAGNLSNAQGNRAGKLWSVYLAGKSMPSMAIHCLPAAFIISHLNCIGKKNPEIFLAKVSFDKTHTPLVLL